MLPGLGSRLRFHDRVAPNWRCTALDCLRLRLRLVPTPRLCLRRWVSIHPIVPQFTLLLIFFVLRAVAPRARACIRSSHVVILGLPIPRCPRRPDETGAWPVPLDKLPDPVVW